MHTWSLKTLPKVQEGNWWCSDSVFKLDNIPLRTSWPLTCQTKHLDNALWKLRQLVMEFGNYQHDQIIPRPCHTVNDRDDGVSSKPITAQQATHPRFARASGSTVLWLQWGDPGQALKLPPQGPWDGTFRAWLVKMQATSDSTDRWQWHQQLLAKSAAWSLKLEETQPHWEY